MVFCGRLSKACQRCRNRRLKCDLCPSSCGQCIRANVICTGYRDTERIRIRNETRTVQRKAASKQLVTFKPKINPLQLEVQARDLFFAYYVTDFSQTWSFLQPFHNPAHAPDYLTLSIDAVSLAFLSHHHESESAMAIGRERYVSALRLTSKALQRPEVAIQDSALGACLLLDMYEKMSSSASHPEEISPVHVKGALALVKMRGLEHFKGPQSIRALMRFATNYTINCVSTDREVPADIVEIRNYCSTYFDVTQPKWRLNGIMIECTNSRAAFREGLFQSKQGYIRRCLEIDAMFLELYSDIPSIRPFNTRLVIDTSLRVFGKYYDIYDDRFATQTWDVIRLTRIILNDTILETCYELALEDAKLSAFAETVSAMASQSIEAMVNDICASIPEMVDCFGAARDKLPKEPGPESRDIVMASSKYPHHEHTPSHQLDCYILIFPLYVAAWSRACPKPARQWIISQLHHVGSHFGIRNASVVAKILESDTFLFPWIVYAMLGSYAFAA